MLKQIVIAGSCLTLGALGTLVSQSHSTTTTPAVSPIYEEGGMVSAYTLDNNRKGQLIGRFFSKKPLSQSYYYNNNKKENPLIGMLEEPMGYEVDAYFLAEQAGEYAFTASLIFPPTAFFTDPTQWQGESQGEIKCRYRLTLASETLFDMEVNSQERGIRDRGCGFTKASFGAIRLEAGKHRLRQWFACSGHFDMKNPAMSFIYPPSCLFEGDSLDVPNPSTEGLSLLVQVRRPQEIELGHFKPSEFVYEKQ